jgi:hypothetical protein
MSRAVPAVSFLLAGALSAGTAHAPTRPAPAVASSAEAHDTTALQAIDGDMSTRWSSAWSDPQWIRIDLGQSIPIRRVRLFWEAAFARDYRIQTSDDADAWTTLYETSSGDGDTDDLMVSGSGRYVRMIGTARGTEYGYSLWELEVYTGAGKFSLAPVGARAGS